MPPQILECTNPDYSQRHSQLGEFHIPFRRPQSSPFSISRTDFGVHQPGLQPAGEEAGAAAAAAPLAHRCPHAHSVMVGGGAAGGGHSGELFCWFAEQ